MSKNTDISSNDTAALGPLPRLGPYIALPLSGCSSTIPLKPRQRVLQLTAAARDFAHRFLGEEVPNDLINPKSSKDAWNQDNVLYDHKYDLGEVEHRPEVLEMELMFSLAFERLNRCRQDSTRLSSHH